MHSINALQKHKSFVLAALRVWIRGIRSLIPLAVLSRFQHQPWLFAISLSVSSRTYLGHGSPCAPETRPEVGVKLVRRIILQVGAPRCSLFLVSSHVSQPAEGPRGQPPIQPLLGNCHSTLFSI